MELKAGNRGLFLIALILISGIIVSDIIYKSDLKYRLETGILNRKITGNEGRALDLIDDIITENSLNEEVLISLKDAADRYGISIARYRGGKLDIWTDNSFEIPRNTDEVAGLENFFFLHNRWVVSGKKSHDNDDYFYFIDIIHSYEIENQYISTGFCPQMSMPDAADFSMDPDKGYPVYNISGNYLFSVIWDTNKSFFTPFLLIPLLLWLGLAVLVIGGLNRLIIRHTGKRGGKTGVFVVLFFSVIAYGLCLLTSRPDILNDLEIFQPYRYTAGKLIPSPGHMFMIGLLMIYCSYSFYKWWPEKADNRQGRNKCLLYISLYFLAGAVMFYSYGLSLSSYVASSNISFSFFRILDIDYFTLIAFLSSSLFLVSTVLYISKVIRLYADCKPLYLVVSVIPGSLLMVLLHMWDSHSFLPAVLTYIAIIYALWIFQRRNAVIVIVSVTLSILAGAYTAKKMSDDIWDAETEKLKVFAINQIGNNDLTAEAILIENWDKIRNDTVLSSMMKLDYFLKEDVNNIYNYLDTAYFTGYWDQYGIFYTVCNYDSPLEIADTGEETNCFEFFHGRIEESGIPVIDTSIYLLDNRSGRPYYIANLFFDQQGLENEQTGLFIEMISQIENVLPGYPELLQNDRYNRLGQIKDYSFAKYINDSLVLQTGKYSFSLKLEADSSDTKPGSFLTFRESDHETLVYNHSPAVSVVIARPPLRTLDIIISFTYIFVIFFILFVLALMLIQPPEKLRFKGFDFRQKLQYAFIGLLLLSILAIGTVMVLLSISQYRDKHFDDISEKLSSVYIELDHKLSAEEVLTADWSQDAYPDLDALLIKFSNVFFTDINLYSKEGDLLASSRREVFDRDLKGSKMDFRAYSMLHSLGEPRFIQEENVGELKYISAYTPFYNYRNEVLAYLNLPYFALQSKLSAEVSNLVVTIINFSLILIVISMVIAVLIAVNITSPLRMLKEGLASVSLDKEVRKLDYRGHDEVSELVKQYNKMLEQLHISAVKLARSEREDAWRDMAKQVAHEIKNPLTPMKLNVQQLLKTWGDKPDDFDRILTRFSKNMIENIENLSSIATEFSRFARVPQAKPVEVNLVAKIESSAELFGNLDNVNIQISCSGFREVVIMADKEQVLSMLTNILRNAVQAIPSKNEGLVKIDLNVADEMAVIMISDNGVGIPPEMGDKLFVPNFTTKSSGMGIGLALVKRIVDTAGGTIRYESVPGKGTTFIIELPLLYARSN